MIASSFMLDTDTFSTLVTNNERHFRHVPGLTLANWTREK